MARARKKAAKKKRAASGRTRTTRPRKRRNPGPRAGGDVVVRMYRTGLGDCFLLSFPRSGRRPFHMLVDCGVFFQTKDEKARMQKIATAIETATRDGAKSYIDVLVATHEHYDHLIGFKHARDVFARFTIADVWLGWPDKPGHPKAGWLRKIQDTLRMGLAAAMADARRDPHLAARAARVEQLLEFDRPRLGAKYSDQLGEVMRWLREDTGATVTYLEPHGAPRALGDVPDARVYVLGPPLDEKRLRKMNDSKSDPESYHLPLAAVPAFLRLAGPGDTASEQDEFATLQMPFDPHWQVPEAGAAKDPRTAAFLARHYGAGEDDPQAWRRITDDWMTMAEELALQLNSLTNNSSLALAIEVGRSRRVILMAADAQVGNWLSWHDHDWTLERDDGTTETVTAAELLGRTVLYKVGHHGSHNATLKAKGLELMTSDELVAMIPVDQAFAKKKKWEMPYRPLLKALQTRTKGRILRVDDGLPSNVEAGVAGAFAQRSAVTELCVEYRVKTG